VAIFQRLGFRFEDTFGQSGVPGGAIPGVSVGLIMGFQIGPTLYLYRRWAWLMEPMACYALPAPPPWRNTLRKSLIGNTKAVLSSENQPLRSCDISAYLPVIAAQMTYFFIQ
jgi:hypothetical protein